MKTEIAERYRVLFIIFVSLGVYYPSIFGSATSVDDFKMLNNLLNTESFDLKGVFFSGSSVYYYRPILASSFLLDQYLWSGSESFMHLENIFLHTLSGVLIFYISKELIRRFKLKAGDFVPMFISLLFILHPINTEPVNWISGRTDILAGFFVFLSFWIFLKKGMDNYIWCWISAFFYLMGLLSKEVAIGLLPAIGLFLALKEKPVENIGIKNKLKLFFPFFVFTIIYFLMRMPSGHIDLGISTAVNVSEDRNFIRDIGSAIKAFGFYIKKLFVPLPLNFGIIEINRTFYLWFGTITSGTALYLFFKRRTVLSFLLFFSILFFLPAIPVAISRMAWTPLAERYLYISSFGVSTLIILMVNRIPWKKELGYGFLAVLLAVFAAITVDRNIIWQSNLTLFEDTVKKSPNFAAGRNDYGIALAMNGKLDEAVKQLEIAVKLSGHEMHRGLPSMNLIYLSGLQKNNEKEAVQKNYLALFSGKTSPPVTRQILIHLIKNAEALVMEEKNTDKKRVFYKEIISYFEQLYKLEGGGFYLYKQGQYYLALDEKEKAVEFFKKAVELSPNEYYSEPARKLAKKLESPKSEINN
ncbi:MAG: tetratricopeptide repeat protein [Thermodesulfovibrionales bacterium]